MNDIEKKEWLDSITDAILAGLVGGEKAPAPPTKKETTVQVMYCIHVPAEKLDGWRGKEVRKMGEAGRECQHM